MSYANGITSFGNMTGSVPIMYCPFFLPFEEYN